MRENRLRCFGHEMRRGEINAIKVVTKMKFEGKKRKKKIK
jgi:hypothetical protein